MKERERSPQTKRLSVRGIPELIVRLLEQTAGSIKQRLTFLPNDDVAFQDWPPIVNNTEPNDLNGVER